jgi:SNF2 family DNA or RNA helicase
MFYLWGHTHRVVLFSQYTRMLDIISDYLDMRGYRHARLDGSTNRVMREVGINLFNKPLSPSPPYPHTLYPIPLYTY